MKTIHRILTVALSASAALALAPVVHAQSFHASPAIAESETRLDNLEMQPGIGGVGLAQIALPDVAEGRLQGDLLDESGRKIFRLEADLSQYHYLLAHPDQGEIHGVLLTPRLSAGTGEDGVFAAVDGQWMKDADGQGHFAALILRRIGPGVKVPLAAVGVIRGTFGSRSVVPLPGQLVPPAGGTPPTTQAGHGVTLQLSNSGPANSGAGNLGTTPSAAAGPIAKSSLIVCYGVNPPAIHELPNGITVQGLGTHVQSIEPQQDSGLIVCYGESPAGAPIQSRVAMRWKLFE